MTSLVAFPLLIPLLVAAICLLGWRRPGWQQRISAVGIGLHFLAAALLAREVYTGGTVTLAVGGWRPPFGIVLVADAASATLALLTITVGGLVILDSYRSVTPAQESFGYYPLVHVLLMGVSGAFLTGDLFNLYVWFEVLLISSFVLLSLGTERAQLHASLKYVTLNLIASAIFLCALGLLYGTFGTLNLADLARRLANGEAKGFGTPLSMMFLVAFGLKAGLVPLHAWLPASYHTPPDSVSALFAALLTKVGVVSLLRFFGIAFRFEPESTDAILEFMAALTMIVGGLGAVCQTDLRRMLSFLVMNGVGAMVYGVACRTSLGTAAAMLYLLHSAVASAAAYLLAGHIRRMGGSYDLRQLGGLARKSPAIFIAWLAVNLSLVGVPPLSGFFGKYALIRAGLESGHTVGLVGLLAASVLVLAAVLRAWSYVFARSHEGPVASTRLGTPVWTMVAAVGLFGVFLGPISGICRQIGEEISHPEEMAVRVLEGRR